MSENIINGSSESDELTKREEFFFEADLKELPVFCGDDRKAEQQYIHEFGGAANTAYTLMVLQEAKELGSVSQPLDETIVSVVGLLKNQGIDAGVHSDDKAETGAMINTTQVDGKIGCGYLQLRRDISQLIGERGTEIINILATQDPELYASDSTRQQAKKFIQVHAQLAQRDIFSTGRQVAIAALQAGASQNLVYGDHAATYGIVNKRANTSFDATAALASSKPAYDHDAWAATETYEAIKSEGGYQFDEVDFEIANDVDTVGTMLALGVVNISVRR